MNTFEPVIATSEMYKQRTETLNMKGNANRFAPANRGLSAMKTNRGTTIMMKIAGLALMLSSWTMAHGQQDQKFAQAMKQNTLALRQYTWKSQTQIRKEGEVKAPRFT